MSEPVGSASRPRVSRMEAFWQRCRGRREGAVDSPPSPRGTSRGYGETAFACSNLPVARSNLQVACMPSRSSLKASEGWR